MYKCFDSNTTGHTYCLNTTRASQAQAQAACALRGGSLVIYDDIFEQQEVEQYFTGLGFLLPKYHKLYWFGLETGKGGARWPNFTWVDSNNAIFRPNYQHWGYIQHPNGAKQLEPNNLIPTESCAGANATLRWSQHGAEAFGWADRNCSEQYISICEVKPPAVAPPFASSVSGATFTFHQIPATFDDAQQVCFAEGGRLASYSSLTEQAEVEQHYASKQHLIPAFHQNYWIGLRSNGTMWPEFSWVDFTPGPTLDTYLHWGSTVPDYLPEPNNELGEEYCAVANYTERYDLPPAWGWADTRCDQQLPFMCKKMTPDVYVYVSPVTNATYVLNTSLTNYSTAAQVCNDNGGFLAAYGTIEEQVDVESYLVNMTYLVPVAHQMYWLGYRSSETGGPFSWVDPQAQGFTYEHWAPGSPGFLAPGGACTAANLTAETLDVAFGWTDSNCTFHLPFMCKIQRGWQCISTLLSSIAGSLCDGAS
jgi:hypothetical protein